MLQSQTSVKVSILPLMRSFFGRSPGRDIQPILSNEPGRGRRFVDNDELG
jgi:hypothetical protein